MQFGIRRRTIDLTPPTEEDVDWVFSSGGSESEQTRAHAKSAHRAKKIVVGVIHRHREQKRVGFLFLIPAQNDTWDFTIMVPDPRDRDLFSALHACDAICHYMFDHVGIAAAVWRIREDNVRAQMLSRRMKYSARGTIEQSGHTFRLYLLDRETWQIRRRLLEARTAGSAFERL